MQVQEQVQVQYLAALCGGVVEGRELLEHLTGGESDEEWKKWRRSEEEEKRRRRRRRRDGEKVRRGGNGGGAPRPARHCRETSPGHRRST